jgi:hypothetical protein
METIKVNDQRSALIKEYADAYNTMTEEQASSYIKRWITVDQDATKLRLNYIPLFEKAIPSKRWRCFSRLTGAWPHDGTATGFESAARTCGPVNHLLRRCVR